MTISEVFKKYNNIEVELLLEKVLKLSKEQLFVNHKQVLTAKQVDKLTRLAHERVKGKPIAYILGYKHFYGLKFKVNKNTLIPRPESEWLVDRAISHIKKNRGRALNIADIGTGSGCLIISTAHTAGNDKIKYYASDISLEALKIAKYNSQIHHANISFKHSDLLSGYKQKFDLIFANLPYVPLSSYQNLKEGLKYEPRNAITTEDEVWKIYNRFLDQASNKLNANGVILFEIDPLQKPILGKEIKKRVPGAKIKFAKDIQGLWRYCEVKAG